MIDIGEALKQQREQRNLTVMQLARETGISRQNIARWETNQVIPNALFCIKLAKFYGISLDELLNFEN